MPYKDKCFLDDEFPNNKSYIVNGSIAVIDSYTTLKIENANPLVFADNGTKELYSVGVTYFKKSLNSSSIIVGFNSSLKIFCSRNLIIDLLPMKVKNLNSMRMRNSRISIPIKQFCNNCTIVIPKPEFWIEIIVFLK